MVATIIEKAIEGAHDLAQIRERLARHAEAGDLDDAIRVLASAHQRAKLFVDEGTIL